MTRPQASWHSGLYASLPQLDRGIRATGRVDLRGGPAWRRPVVQNLDEAVLRIALQHGPAWRRPVALLHLVHERPALADPLGQLDPVDLHGKAGFPPQG